ncbi:hypothetical protein [Bosea sp. LjRoot237]|uniref:hypothetical protein n=1 Tax=Bosea sp. LjRoot237 TaxID=3342292 RepID=UPI003ECC5C86
MSILIPGKDVPRPTHLLDAGEQLIWWDRPNPKEYALKEASIFKALFLLLFTAFGAGVTWSEFHAGTYFWLFGLILVVAPLFCLAEPIWRYQKAPRVQYLLTDRRAVIATDRSVKSVALNRIDFVELDRGEGGVGDVLFIVEQVKDAEGETITNRDGFVGIADAEKVERELRRLQQLALS